MQGMPGALQVLAALLHGVQTIHTNDNGEFTVHGSLSLAAIQVKKATAFFQQALLPHELWAGALLVCLAEHHDGKVLCRHQSGWLYRMGNKKGVGGSYTTAMVLAKGVCRMFPALPAGIQHCGTSEGTGLHL